MVEAAKPHINIERIYWVPFEEGGITYSVERHPYVEEFIGGVVEKNRAIIDEVRKRQGTFGILPINLPPSQADELAERIRMEPEWLSCLEKNLSLLAPKLMSENGLEKLAGEIFIPWFNEASSAMTKDSYNASAHKLELGFSTSHSYINQLARKGYEVGYGLPSVSNVLVCRDNVMMCGWRGGRHLNNTIMTIPAGSLMMHEGDDPLFESFYDEHIQELRLGRNMILSGELIGKVSGPHIPNQPHFVTISRIALTSPELEEWWRRAVDRKEHRLLYRLPKGREEIREELEAYAYRWELEDKDNRSKTSMDNVGRFLPQASSSLLAYLIYESRNLEWGSWAARAQGIGLGEQVGKDYEYALKR